MIQLKDITHGRRPHPLGGLIISAYISRTENASVSPHVSVERVEPLVERAQEMTRHQIWQWAYGDLIAPVDELETLILGRMGRSHEGERASELVTQIKKLLDWRNQK